MKRTRLISHLAICVGTGWLSMPHAVLAVPDPSVSIAFNQAPVTLAGRGGDFSDVLKADVAAGYMTQAQADVLTQDYERFANQRDDALSRLQSQMSTLSQNSKTQLEDSVAVLKNFGQDAETAQEQVDVFVDTLIASERENLTLLNAINQALSVYASAVSDLVTKRAEIVGQSPNLSREQRAAINLEASRVARSAYAISDTLQKASVAQETKVARAENQAQDAKRDIGKETKEKAPKIKEYTDKYGADPRNWPQDADNPLPIVRSPGQPPARPQVANQPSTPPSPGVGIDRPGTTSGNQPSPSGNNGGGSRPTNVTVERETSRPVVVPNRRGTVPTNQNDPGLSVNRNNPNSQSTQAPTVSSTTRQRQTANNQTPPARRAPPPPQQLTPADIERIANQRVTLPKRPPPTKPTQDIGLPSARPPSQRAANPRVSQTANNAGAVAGATAGTGLGGNSGAGAGARVGAIAGTGTKPNDPNQGLKLPPLGRAGRGGDGNTAGGSGGGTGDQQSGGDGSDVVGTPDRLTASEISAAGDGLWTVGDSFNGQAPKPRAMNFTWPGIEANGPMTTLELERIYQGYDVISPRNGNVARSLSAAPISIPLNWTLPSFGDAINPLVWTSLDLNGLPVTDQGYRNHNLGRVTDLASQNRSPYRALFDYSDFQGPSPYALRPWEDIAPTLVSNLYAGRKPSGRGYATISDPSGQDGLISLRSRFVGYLSGEDDFLTQLATNGRGGLDQLLAQPFNVLLTWGAGAFDLDLHMTGPLGEGTTSRFHIYYANRGDLTQLPFAELITDCICNSGSEVILTSQLVKGGVYRISVFNFGDQAASSTILSSLSDAEIQIVRGGQAVSVGSGTTIVGGRTIYRGKPKRGQQGNTWAGVEINATTGRIFASDTVTQTQGSDNVR